MTDIHPLLKPLRAPIATRPIERFANAIVSAIQAEYRGLVVFGLARFGKTWAIRYLCLFAHWLTQPAFITRVSIPKSHARSDGAFFSLFLSAFNLKVPERTSALERLRRVCNFLTDRCEELSSNLIVIFLDESQRLFPDDYEHLATLDNELTERGYMVFIVFVIQRDFNGGIDEKIYDGAPPPHVRGRFLIRRHEFGGLDGEAEVAHAMSRYDDNTEWPAGSGVSYSAHFANKAFAAGWRLRSHAIRLLEIAETQRTANRLATLWTWPMKSFEVCINFLLTNIVRRRADFDGFTDEDLREALDASGFIELELSRGIKTGEDD